MCYVLVNNFCLIYFRQTRKQDVSINFSIFEFFSAVILKYLYLVLPSIIKEWIEKSYILMFK